MAPPAAPGRRRALGAAALDRLRGRLCSAAAAAPVRVFWCLFVLAPRRAAALVTTFSLPPADNLWTSLADFGLAPDANVRLEIHNDRPANDTYLLMFTYAQWLEFEPWELPQGDSGSRPGYTSYMASSWRRPLYNTAFANFTVNAQKPDRYILGVLNSRMQKVKLHGELALVNPGGQQLPLQEEGLPTVLLFAATLYLCSCAAFVIWLLVVARRGRTHLHLVMASVLLVKGIVLLLHWRDRLQVCRTGSDSVLGEKGWQLLDKAQTVMELMMFLLVALGWKFLRNTLNVTEVRFAIGISVISFYLGVFEVACTNASTCSGYELSRYILHSLCYLVVIVAMNFNLQMIQAQLAEAPASMEAAKLYRKLRAFKAFRWIFLTFIVAPTVEVFLKVSVLPWDALWTFELIQQLRTWAIYVSVLIFFRPKLAPLRVFELTRDVVSDDEGTPAEAVAAGPAALPDGSDEP